MGSKARRNEGGGLQMGGLARNLTLFDAVMIGLGTMLGAGVFVLTGVAAHVAGPGALVSFVLAGLTVLFTACSFAELSTAYPKAGGPYTFVYKAFSEDLAFLTGWSLWIGLTLTTSFYCVGFSQYLSFLLPIPLSLGAFSLAGLVLLINALGSKGFSVFQNWVVGLLLGILCLYLFMGLRNLDPSLHKPFFPYGFPPVLRMASVLFISFLGFELIATAAEEIQDPGRTIPRATLFSVVLVTLIYACMVFITTGVTPYFELGESLTPIADTARILMGPTGGFLLLFAGLLATISSANGALMAASRIGFAMSRDALLPSLLGRVHPKFKTPLPSMLVTGLLVCGALFKGDIEWLAEAAAFLHLYPFVLVNIALLRLRGQKEYRPAFSVPFGPLLPCLGIASSLLLLSQLQSEDIFIGLLLLTPGLLYYSFRSGNPLSLE